jgi:hypothetical protein
MTLTGYLHGHASGSSIRTEGLRRQLDTAPGCVREPKIQYLEKILKSFAQMRWSSTGMSEEIDTMFA